MVVFSLHVWGFLISIFYGKIDSFWPIEILLLLTLKFNNAQSAMWDTMLVVINSVYFAQYHIFSYLKPKHGFATANHGY